MTIICFVYVRWYGMLLVCIVEPIKVRIDIIRMEFGLGPNRRFRRIVEHMQKLIAERPVVLDSSTIVNFSDSKQHHPVPRANGCSEEVEMMSSVEVETQRREALCNHHSKQHTSTKATTSQSQDVATDFCSSQQAASSLTTSPTAKNKSNCCKCSTGSSSVVAKAGANNKTTATATTAVSSSCDATMTPVSCLLRVQSECGGSNNANYSAAALDNSSLLAETTSLSPKMEQKETNNNITREHVTYDEGSRTTKTSSPSSPERPSQPASTLTAVPLQPTNKVTPPNYLPFLAGSAVCTVATDGSQHSAINSQIFQTCTNQTEDGASTNMPSKSSERRVVSGHRRCTSDGVKTSCANGFDSDFDTDNRGGQYI